MKDFLETVALGLLRGVEEHYRKKSLRKMEHERKRERQRKGEKETDKEKEAQGSRRALSMQCGSLRKRKTRKDIRRAFSEEALAPEHQRHTENEKEAKQEKVSK